MLDDFLHSLCRWMVAQAAALIPTVGINYATGTLDQLFRWEANESSADPALYSVVTIYSGRSAQPDYLRPTPRLNLQVATVGQSNKAAVARAEILFNALTAADGTPMRMQTIPGYLAADNTASGHWLIVNADRIQRPGLAGRDDRNRPRFAFNFEVEIQQTS